MSPDPWELVDSIVEENLEAREARPGSKLIVRNVQTGLTKDQWDLIAEAAQARRFGNGRQGIPTYFSLSAMAFTAYDLGYDFFEVLSGLALPENPAIRQVALDASRRMRGQWGITSLADRTRGAS